MKTKKHSLIILNILFFISISVFGKEFDLPPFVTINSYATPTAVLALNKAYLVYELFVTNYMNTPVNLVSLEVTNGSNNFTISSNDLEKLVYPVNPDNKMPLIFQPGEAKVIHMWLEFDNLSKVSNKIDHQFTFSVDNQTYHINYPELSVNKMPVIVNAPLRGYDWVTANGLSNTSVHRISVLYFNGKAYDSERYAIDFLQADHNSSTFKGAQDKNSSYYCYNQDVLAVADSKVVALKDGIPENIPRSGKYAVPIDIENMGGNYIILDLGNGAYAGYGHLIPGSLRVKVGDNVKSGQVIGKLGNSGHSSEPHLHFHITNKPSMLVSDGIPYGFKQFTVTPMSVQNGKMVFINEQPIKYFNQLPLEDMLINFDN